MDPDYALFAEVVDAGSLSAAGRRLNISPAMVSKRMARLEARLGTRLIHRTTRRLSLTESGAAFYDDVRAILAAIAAAEARLAGRGGVGGPLRVSAPTSFGRLHVAPHLKGLIDAHPGIDLELNLSDDYSDLIAERIDLAIRIAPAIGPGLAGTRLATSRRLLCAAPAYLATRGAPETLDDLARHPLLAAAGQMPWRLEGPEGPRMVTGHSRVRTNSSEVVREATLAGMGIALRSIWDVGRDIAEGRLARVLPAYQGSSDVGIYAVHPRAPQLPANVAAFIGWFEALYAEPAPWEG